MARPSDKIGPYTLVSKLGRGAFGVVWLAEKRSILATTKVALKLPNDEDVDLDAVRQEAEIWVHASGHPNVLPIIDADVYDDQVVIVSEYAPDGSLSKWLDAHDGTAPSVDAAAEMALGILAGLEHLHERGIIHRDLKPDNILLQRETPRLADFGIARILKTTSKSTIATGTPVYMSPEAFDGKRNEQTDIWSIGVIFYQLLAGRLPFDQTDMASLLAAILTKDIHPLPESVPEPIRTVAERALKKDSRERWQSAGEMREALREAVRASSLRRVIAETHPPLAVTIPAETLENPTPAVPITTIAAVGKVNPGEFLRVSTLTALPLASPPIEHAKSDKTFYRSKVLYKKKPLMIGAAFVGLLLVASLFFFMRPARVHADLSSPRTTLRAHYDAMVKNDYDTYKETWAKVAIDRFTQSAVSRGKSFDEYFQASFADNRKGVAPTMWEIQNEDISNDSAWLTVKEKDGTARVKFYKEDGVWKIVGWWQ